MMKARGREGTLLTRRKTTRRRNGDSHLLGEIQFVNVALAVVVLESESERGEVIGNWGTKTTQKTL